MARVNLKRQVERAIATALDGRSRLTLDVLRIEGLSSPTVRHFLNNLCDFPSVNYLEVGTFKGSTLVSASYANKGRFTSIDSFRRPRSVEVLPACMRATTEAIRDDFRRVKAQFKDFCQFTFHEADCWSARLFSRLPRKVNVYFFDGPHKYQDQFRAFVHFDPLFADTFVALVDDWNYREVRDGTRDAFKELGYKTVFKREFFTKNWVRDHWWNGIFVAVVKRPVARRKGATTSAKPRARSSR